MKLIIKEYLSSLKERGELDVVLPDLLSQLGLNVYSRPGRGIRQDGVDVGAVGSILYPIIALFAALIDDDSTYKKIVNLRKEFLQHCTFQFWYPDEISESHFYTNSDIHGGALSRIDWDRSMADFLTQIFGECKHSPHFKDLSAVKFGLWPLIIVACRHYRMPVPLHLLEGLKLL